MQHRATASKMQPSGVPTVRPDISVSAKDRDEWVVDAPLLLVGAVSHLRLGVILQADLFDQRELGFEPFDVLFGVP